MTKIIIFMKKSIDNIDHKCTCEFCITYDKFRWATIMECKCCCHNDEEILGHDELCCPFPNGKKKNNPHVNLKPALEYRKLLDSYNEL